MNLEFEKKKLYSCIGKDLLSYLKRGRCYLAGGTITSLMCNREINDLDIYFKDEESLLNFVEDIWGDGWIISQTNKALLIKFKKQKDVQLIYFKYFEKPEDIFDTFDFTACMGCFDFETEQFYFHEDFFKHNAQRILKFNKYTAYPIISLLRVQKYKDKGYTISKPELIRIIMKCMDLNITTVEELKEQTGGMYGENFDNLFKDVPEGEFSLDKAIDLLENLVYDDKYFDIPKNARTEFGSMEEFVDELTNGVIKYLEVKEDEPFRILNGNLRLMDDVPEKAEKVDAEEFFNTKRFYKFVCKKDDRYYSFYDKTFEYVIGKEAVAKGTQWGIDDPVLFFNDFNKIDKSTYAREKKDRVLIETCIENVDDFYGINSNGILLKRCRVLREVPHSEYAQYLNEGVEDFGE